MNKKTWLWVFGSILLLALIGYAMQYALRVQGRDRFAQLTDEAIAKIESYQTTESFEAEAAGLLSDFAQVTVGFLCARVYTTDERIDIYQDFDRVCTSYQNMGLGLNLNEYQLASSLKTIKMDVLKTEFPDEDFQTFATIGMVAVAGASPFAFMPSTIP